MWKFGVKLDLFIVLTEMETMLLCVQEALNIQPTVDCLILFWHTQHPEDWQLISNWMALLVTGVWDRVAAQAEAVADS